MMTELETEIICLTREQHAVYSCLCYFDVFKHPVNRKEITEYTGANVSPARISAILTDLQEMELVVEQDGFYFLDQVKPALVARRADSEKRFQRRQGLIRRFARVIASFPFVESLAISGSCSKGLMDKEGDVDYFVITTPQRVWLCRTLLIAFKKVFLLNSKKYFCVNYFIDVNNLAIPDHNAFVAMELKTLVPLSNKALFDTFLEKNAWANQFLPNKSGYNTTLLKEKKSRKYVFGWVEWLFAGRLGDLLDAWCFRLTLASWERKFPHFSRSDFDLNLRSRKTVSKHHPRGFQQRVLAEWHKKLEKVKVLV